MRLARTVLVVLLLLPAAAHAAQPASLFNANGQIHALACVQLANSPAALRFTDGTPTGFEVTNALSFNDGRCPSNTVRLDYHEAIPTAAGALVFHRGGNGYTDEPNTKYGHLLTGDIATPLGDPVPSGGGRGAPCASVTGAHRVQVRSLAEDMHYKHPSQLPNGSNRGSSWEHYGDPGADQGNRTDIHYSYLLWSYLNVRGGGIVRTLLAHEQVVRACDVEPIEMPSWDRDGNVNGSVTGRYVRALVGNCPVYGWMVWSHTYAGTGGVPVAHAVPHPTAPADPQPDSACPQQAAAAPPVATTGDAGAAEDGSATLTGTVDPKGTPGTYRFEYGSTPDHGSVTEERAVSARPNVYSFSAALSGLQPGATYHYRIVATGEHGTHAGENRTVTVPVPPPPPPPEPPPAPPEPVALSSLQVAPTAFRRSRSRLGNSASIRYVLSKPAAVTFTFRKGLPGMVVGTKCKTPPRRGIPRGRKRCTRWVAVPGSLTQVAMPAGPSRQRFGGWLGRRALSAGRYRVSALPADGGPAAVTRVAGFRIR